MVLESACVHLLTIKRWVKDVLCVACLYIYSMYMYIEYFLAFMLDYNILEMFDGTYKYDTKHFLLRSFNLNAK